MSKSIRASIGVLVWLLLLAFPEVARAAIVQQVQSGTATNTANGTQTITISSIDLTRSVLFFETRSNGNRPVNSMLRGRLASATTIEFIRVTDEGSPSAITIQWYVATFGSGVNVQRGETVVAATTTNQAITAVAAMSQAFVLWSKAPGAADADWGTDDPAVVDLTSTTNLQFRTTAASSHTVSWQVVEFTTAADITVQRGTVTNMTGATVTTTATLGTAVDTSRTFVLASFRTAGGGADIGARTLRAQLTNTTTITFDRGIAGDADDMPEIAWQCIELKDGSSVNRGNASFAAGASQAIGNFPTRMNQTRSVAFGSVQAGGGQNMGRTAYAADDILGVATATTTFGTNQLTLDRSNTAAAADVSWVIVQFAGGNGVKVGTFTKTQGTAPASQTIAHGLGEVPKAMILWTESRPNETFSDAPNTIAFRGAATGSGASGSTSVTINVPTGTVPNDAMIATIGFRPTSVTVTPPAGWTLIRRLDDTSGSVNSLAIYGRVASYSEPASYTWTMSTTTGIAGGISSFSGVDPTGVDVEAGQNTPSATTHSTPSVTTTGANELILATHEVASATTWTTPAGMTAAFDISADAVPSCCGITTQVSYVVQAAAGATGAKSANIANDLDTGNAHIMALRPVPANLAYFGWGMTDGTTSRSVSSASLDGGASSDASTRMANKALTIVRWGEVTLAEADLTSWDSTNFTLNWTTNDLNPSLVHYIAIGGSDVSAKVVDWTMGTATGNKAVTGVGFAPDVAIHAHGGFGFTAALPASQADAVFGLGVMDFDGDQWAFSTLSRDNAGTTDTQRGQQTDAAIYSFNNALTVQKEASWVSMDTDGFTVNFTNATSANASRVFTLALKGINIKPGSFTKDTGAAPDSQAITGVGFQPSLVFLASTQNTTQAAPNAHARFGIGASDGTTVASSSVSDTNGAGTSNVAAIDKTSKMFVKVNNGTPAVNAEANLTSRDTDGFTLNWTTNDAVATQMLYFAIAPLAVTEVRLITFTAARDARGVRLAWRTGYESDNLGFHLYREVDGQRTRVTRSLVAGSGLMVASRSQTANERAYSYWDTGAASQAPGVVYWLEDVDFDGRTTWHGPVSPESTAIIETPSNEDSRTLAGLGRGTGLRQERFVTAAPEEKDGAMHLVAAVSDAEQAQWTLAGQAAVKIAVRAPGWYRVGQPALLAAGLAADVDPRTLRLYVNGVEQAMRVTGESDGQLDAGDAIEFYGEGTDTPATDTRVYWLAAGQGNGLRIATAASGSGAAAPASFLATLERKDRSIYFAALENGEADNWFGAVVSTGEAVDVNVTVRHPDPAAPGAAALQVVLQGVTATTEAVDHLVGVKVNGVGVGDVSFQGRAQGIATLTVPHALLIEGVNVVRFETLGGDADIALFDTLRLSYWHTNDADDGQLRLTADGQQVVTLRGFTAGARVVDITDSAAAIELTTSAGPDPQSIVVQVPGSGTHTLLAFADSAIATPAAVAANQPSSLHDPSRSHDYVVVSHPDFAGQVAPLTALRTSQGHQTALVSIEDVYDEFGFGEKSPQALKDFLTYARTSWASPPKYVVLVGDATFDPRDYQGFGGADFVPTKLLGMTEASLETASDDWFVDANSDGDVEIAIGRLPARSPAQAAAMVAKIVGYEAEPDGPWTKNVTFVTDRDDSFVRFRATSGDLQAKLPAEYQAHVLDRYAIGVEGVRSGLFSQLNQGQLLVNYLGHGSVSIWGASGEIMTAADVASWTTTGSRLPIVVDMTCLNGYFQGIFDEASLAESLVRAANGGAVAVWASSSVTSAETQGLMNQELFRQMFIRGVSTLGDAIRGAKLAVPDGDVRRSWVLFGDPALKIKALPPARETAPPPSPEPDPPAPPAPTPPPALPRLTASATALNFGASTSAGQTTITPAQLVRLTQSGVGFVEWAVTADRAWIQVDDAAGAGSGQFAIGIAAASLPAASDTGTVTVTAPGIETTLTIAVRLSIEMGSAPFGVVETPIAGASGVSGSFAVTGWALDDIAVRKVQIFRDAVGSEVPGSLIYVGDAIQVDGARPDVEAQYPLLPLNSRAGWGYLLLTNQLPQQGNGTFTLRVRVADDDGNQTWIGTRTFTADNAHATRPFGAIDTPAQGGTASGSAYVNFGWALTPQPKIVPTDGSTILVYVDGVQVGRSGALGPRADISALFPGLANTLQAAGAYLLDTMQLADGLHTIAWVVTDSEGAAAGIGSRFFTVDNANAPAAPTGSVVAAPPAALAAATLAASGDRSGDVRVRLGFGDGEPFALEAGADGVRRVTTASLGRIEIRLPPGDDGTAYGGYVVFDGERRALPVGSTLDARGVFSWQPGPGFAGTFRLLFERTRPDGTVEPIPVDVILKSR